jgi:hypothetical protein
LSLKWLITDWRYVFVADFEAQTLSSYTKVY